MDYLPVEMSLQALLIQSLPLSPAQCQRLSTLGIALLLAGEVHLSKVARFVNHLTSQATRVRWIERLLEAVFMSQSLVYPPFLKVALSGFHERCWHLVIDRSTLWDGRLDLVTISLNYRKRAIPLVWCRVGFGGAPLSVYTALVRTCVPLVPTSVKVVFHGDTEFGGAEMIRTLRELKWDFMLAQKGHRCFRRLSDEQTQTLASLPVTRRHACQVANVDLFATDPLGGINVLAFYQPRSTQSGKRTHEVCYLATSLPLTDRLRRLGRRRWGTEPFYRDYKSAGWHLTWSRLKHPARQEGLLIMIALIYLWTVCLGRWLCKTGQRAQIDPKPQRHFSLCRLGWDWLIHQLRCNLLCPSLLRLYT